MACQDGGLYKIDLEKVKSRRIRVSPLIPLNLEDNYSITARIYKNIISRPLIKTFGLELMEYGIYMLSNVPEKFQKFQNKLTDAYGSSFLRYYGMCMDDEGYLWMGTDGDGIYKKKLNGEVVKYYRADGQKGSLTSNNILCAYKDRSNTSMVLAPSYPGNLHRYDKKIPILLLILLITPTILGKHCV